MTKSMLHFRVFSVTRNQMGVGVRVRGLVYITQKAYVPPQPVHLVRKSIVNAAPDRKLYGVEDLETQTGLLANSHR